MKVRLPNLRFNKDSDSVKGMSNQEFIVMDKGGAIALLEYEYKHNSQTVGLPEGWELKDGKVKITTKSRK